MARLVLTISLLLLVVLLEPARTEPVPDGAPFPDLILQLQAQEAEYLGAPGKGEVQLSAIAARGVIINVYSLYCPPCHREAERLNTLYRIMLERDIPVKIIGLAAGNGAGEVESYRSKHEVPFPLIEDPEYAMHEATGSLPVPSFYVVSLQGGVPTVALSMLGEVTDEEEFLAKALKALGHTPCPGR